MNRPLRIAVATHFFPSSSQPYRGRPIYEITKALAKLAEVRVFCVDLAYPRYKILQPRTFLYRDPAGSYAPFGVDAEYLTYSGLPVVTRLVNGFNCGRVLVPRLRRFVPDVIIGYNVYPEGCGVASAARKLGVPVMIGAIGSDILGIRSYFIRQITARTLRSATFVATVSNDLRERVIKYGIRPDRTRTIHNGCDFAIFKPSSRERARIELDIEPDAEMILFVGRLVPLKGVRELLEATAILAAARSRLRVVMIGEGPLDRKLRHTIPQKRISRHVALVGDASPQEIARWLAAANVFCLPSHSEGCPNVLIEALTCGRPVVASNVGGIPELLNSRCGILVPPNDVQRLAQGLSRALDQPWDSAEIARSSRRSWDQVARETYEVCCAAVQNSNTSRAPRHASR